MNRDALKVGGIYWVAGKGPMKLAELPDAKRGKVTITMEQPPYYRYWAGADELMPVSVETMRFHIADYQRAFPSGERTAEKLRVLREWLAEMEAAQ